MELPAVFKPDYDSWTQILTHQGPWDHVRAAAMSMWATYALLSVTTLRRDHDVLGGRAA